jgi:hemoglobin
MYKNKNILVVVVFLTISNLVACSSLVVNNQSSSEKIQSQSLFQRIGGLPVLTKIVDESIDLVANSPRTKRSFDGIKLAPLKESIVMQLCKITDGGCIYEGETMLNSHRDAKISEAEFDAFVDIFREVLTKYLPTREKNELLKILAPMKRDIVTPL